MALKTVQWDILFPLAAREAGAYSSGPVSAPGSANNLIICTFVSAVSGTTRTLDLAVQTSPDGATWTTVQAGTQMTAVGQQIFNAYIGSNLYGQLLATVGGTGTPIVTFQSVAVVM